MNLKIISFCLWGDLPKYNVGAIRNAELAQKIYPDWICRFHIANTPVTAQHGKATRPNIHNVEIVVQDN